jgi:N-methylhydantoinase A/oxoprolinase/acetone carboxylase beta subunit
MKKKYIIGIDVGGTNTDAVMIDSQKNIIATSKVSTSHDGISGIINALSLLKNNSNCEIEKICIGTTLGLNAILQGSDECARVGLLRIAGHNPDTIEPCITWQNHNKKNIVGYYTISGGYECDGRELSNLHEHEILEAAKKLIDKGAERIVINSVFGCMYRDHEQKVSDIIKQNFNTIEIDCASDFFHIGYVERENTALINSMLKKNFSQKLQTIKNELQKIVTSLFIVDNNGLLITIEEAIKYPIKTIVSGPINSCVGGMLLSKKSNNVIVIDIGGTSTDIGLVENETIRKSLHGVSVGGINLAIQAPDIITCGLGGGSIITKNNTNYEIGPKSVGNTLFENAYGAGGLIPTLSDVAYTLTIFNNEKFKKNYFTKEDAEIIMNKVIDTIEMYIEKITLKIRSFDIVIVGGGALLLPEEKIKQKKWIIPDNCGSANAYGAACAKRGIIYQKIITSLSEEDTRNKYNEIYDIVKKKLNSEEYFSIKTDIISQVEFPYSSDGKKFVEIKGIAL